MSCIFSCLFLCTPWCYYEEKKLSVVCSNSLICKAIICNTLWRELWSAQFPCTILSLSSSSKFVSFLLLFVYVKYLSNTPPPPPPPSLPWNSHCFVWSNLKSILFLTFVCFDSYSWQASQPDTLRYWHYTLLERLTLIPVSEKNHKGKAKTAIWQ